MKYQLIASPYPEGHLVASPGRESGIRIGASRYARSVTDVFIRTTPERRAVMPDPDGTGPGDPPLRTVEQVLSLLRHGANLLVDRDGAVHVLEKGSSDEAGLAYS
jgi:hypothetical protein